MFNKHTAQHLWAWRYLGVWIIWICIKKIPFFSNFSRITPMLSPDFSSLSPLELTVYFSFRALATFQDVWSLFESLSIPPTAVWAQSQNLVPWLLVPSTRHWLAVQEAPTEGNWGPFPICDLSSHWPKSICKKPAGIHTQYLFHWHSELLGPALTSRKSLWQNLSFEIIMKQARAVMWTLAPP